MPQLVSTQWGRGLLRHVEDVSDAGSRARQASTVPGSVSCSMPACTRTDVVSGKGGDESRCQPSGSRRW
jgi:hypothetical protein